MSLPRADVKAVLEKCRAENRRPKIYLGGPYRAETDSGIHRNCQYMWEFACRLWAKGYAVVCPHMNSYHMDGIAPAEVFLDGDLEFLRMCDLMGRADTWRSSAGTKTEVQLALDLEIPVLSEAECAELPDWEVSR